MGQWILNNKANINAFVHFQYKPFSKTQYVKSFFVLLILSIGLCCIGAPTPFWCILTGILCIGVLLVFLLLVTKYAKTHAARFISDGIRFLWAAILLNLACYRFLCLEIGQSAWLIFLSFLLSVFSLIFWAVSVLKNIENGSYLGQSNYSGNGCAVVPVTGAALGIVAIRIFSRDMPLSFLFSILGILCALLSFLCYVGIGSLLKLYFYWKLKDTKKHYKL